MAALVVLIFGAATAVAGAVLGWTGLGRGLFVGGVFVAFVAWDLLPRRPEPPA